MRIMIHAPHPTRRRHPRRTSSAAPHRPAALVPRPPGDGPAVRRRLVRPTHRRPPALPPPHRTQGPAPLPPTGRRGLRQAAARPAARPGPPRPPHRPAGRPAPPGTHLDLRPTGRSLAAPRRHPGHAPGPPLPPAPQGRLPPHGLDAQAQAGRRQGRARRDGPGRLEKKADAGRLKLLYLDESGFSPSLPLGYSWCWPGQRKRVPYEYPQGRRINVLAAYEPLTAEPWLGSQAFERTLTSEDLLAYLTSLPAAEVPRVVVLDNASIHVSKAFKAQRKEL